MVFALILKKIKLRNAYNLSTILYHALLRPSFNMIEKLILNSYVKDGIINANKQLFISVIHFEYSFSLKIQKQKVQNLSMFQVCKVPRNNYWEGSVFEGALFSEPSSQLSVAQRNSVLNWFKTGLACLLQRIVAELRARACSILQLAVPFLLEKFQIKKYILTIETSKLQLRNTECKTDKILGVPDFSQFIKIR